MVEFQAPTKEKQHYKFVEQRIVSGIADFIQIYFSYTIEPKQNCVCLHFRFVNVSSFEVSAVIARLCLTAGVEIVSSKSKSNILNIVSLPPKQTKLWNLSTRLLGFSECQGFIQIECDSPSGKISWRSLPFSISVWDLILDDFSSINSSSMFSLIYNQLPHRTYFQSKLNPSSSPPTRLFKLLSQNHPSALAIQQIEEGQSGDQVFRFGLQHCTWFGSRVLIMVRGIYNSRFKDQTVRIEIRAIRNNDMLLIKKQIKSFLPGIIYLINRYSYYYVIII